VVALGVGAGPEDPSFGKREDVVTREPPPRVAVGAVVPGPAGGSYVIANSEPATASYARDGGTLIVLRYDRRGRPVRSFGRAGSYRTRLAGRPIRARGAMRQGDGKLVVVGSIGRAEEQDLLIARFFPDGTLDGAFGNGGMQTLDIGRAGEAAVDVAVQPDGALVVAGETASPRPPDPALREMVLLRLRRDGRFDESFAAAGVLRLPPEDLYPSDTDPAAVAVAPDGTILMAGTENPRGPHPDGNYWPVVARVPPDGSRADLFPIQVNETSVAGMALDRASGRLYLGGTTQEPVYGGWRMSVTALRGDLTLDSSFGRQGVALADFAGSSDIASAMIRDSRGRIVLAGVAGRVGTDHPWSAFALVRFTSGGRLDPAFGHRGQTLVRFRAHLSVAQALVEQPRGRLLAAGIAGADPINPLDGTGRAVALARLVSDRRR